MSNLPDGYDWIKREFDYPKGYQEEETDEDFDAQRKENNEEIKGEE